VRVCAHQRETTLLRHRSLSIALGQRRTLRPPTFGCGLGLAPTGKSRLGPDFLMGSMPSVNSGRPLNLDRLEARIRLRSYRLGVRYFS